MGDADLKHKFERELEGFKLLQREMQQLGQSRAQLLQQSNENRMVLEELSRLDDDANIFKLIGPALIKQDQLEAKSNVQKRLDYIKGELTRVDGQITALEAKATDKQTELMKLQKKQQAAAAAKGSAS